MSQRFVIESNGIWENGRQLSWGEVCDTLNKLDSLCDEQLDEYEYIMDLERENQFLKEKIVGISALVVKINDYLHDINSIIELRR